MSKSIHNLNTKPEIDDFKLLIEVSQLLALRLDCKMVRNNLS